MIAIEQLAKDRVIERKQYGLDPLAYDFNSEVVQGILNDLADDYEILTNMRSKLEGRYRRRDYLIVEVSKRLLEMTFREIKKLRLDAERIEEKNEFCEED